MSFQLSRVLLLGHSGFIGSALARRLHESRPGIEVVGLSYPPFDLTAQERIAELREELRPGTAVVMLSAVKRQSGDTLENYLQNQMMVVNLCRALEGRSSVRVVFFSSTAVYGEDVHNTEITEATPVRPRSYYGMAKYSGERILAKAFQSDNGRGLVLLRPATVYGAGEPGTGYTPTGFLRKMRGGERLTLWGDGSELREFIYIDDLTALTERLIFSDFSGVVNIVSGRSRTFQEIAAAAVQLVGGGEAPDRKPRSKDKVDNCFVPTYVPRLFPEFTFTSIEDGMRRINELEAAAASAGGVK
ncbi:MAG: NAD-dependent epimerase/dehydratase family protein [Elusimicrobiota bacterium]